MTLAECYEGFDPSEASSRFEELKRLSDQILEEFRIFEFKTKMRLNKRDRARVTKFGAALGVTVVLCVALFTPFCAEAAFVARGLAAAGGVTTVYLGQQLYVS